MIDFAGNDWKEITAAVRKRIEEHRESLCSTSLSHDASQILRGRIIDLKWVLEMPTHTTTIEPEVLPPV